jgi:hypothetical protein
MKEKTPCRLFVGLHQPSDAKHFNAAFVSVNRLRNRKSDFKVGDWIMDSGAFTEIATHGKYRESVDGYVEQIERWSKCGNMLAAVSQDYMCEAWILEKTGLTIADHQRLTIERYDAIQSKTSVYIMPVLQVRPDLRLHGFGLKTTALSDGGVFDLLHTADSMAWSFAARKQGRNANDYREAQNFERRILSQERQGRFF